MKPLFFYFALWATIFCAGIVSSGHKFQGHSRMDDEIAAAREASFKKPVKLRPRQNGDPDILKAKQLLITEPCTIVADSLKQQLQFPINTLRRCYKIFPYDSARAAQTIDTVNKLLEMYAFLDYNNGKGPLKINPKKIYTNKREELEAQKDDQEVDVSMAYNLKAAIKKVAQATYKTDFDFQEALAKAFIPAKDGHLWYKPYCYRQFRFLQPVYLVGRLRGTKMEVVLGGIENSAKKPEQRFLGSVVTHIDGENAVEHLVKYARDEYGKCRSAPTRLARVMTTVTFDPSDGFFRYERGYFARRDSIPENDMVEYTFYDQKTGISTKVSVDWRVEVYKTHKFQNNQEYWNEVCQGSENFQENAKANSQSEVNMGEPLRNMIVDKDQGFLNSAGEAETKGEKIQDDVHPITKGPGIGFFLMKDEDGPFGVISVSTFDFGGKEIDEWVNVVINSLNLFKKNGVNRILVDFSNNGGGNACMANAFARIMSSADSKHPFPYPDKLLDSRVRVSNTLEALRVASAKIGESNIFTPGYFNCVAADGKLNRCSNQMTWGDLKAAENEELRLRVSPDVVDRCSDPELASLEPLRNFKMWTPNVYLLTNGYCGSACATALAMLRYQEHLVAHFHYKAPCPPGMGKQECHSKAPFSFAGGQALYSNTIFAKAKQLGLFGDANFPKPFVTNSELSIAYRALIDRQYPLDLMHWNRNYIAIEPNYNQVIRIELRWKQALKAVKEYKTKLGPLLQLRQEIREFEGVVDKLDTEYRTKHELYEKKFAECEKIKTDACVKEVNDYATLLNDDLLPKVNKLKDQYDAKVKVLEEETKRANKNFGGKR